jgi:hypothetical protein
VYLWAIYQEALRRGYRFREEKIIQTDFEGQLPCTRGQVLYEWGHLRKKLQGRDRQRYREVERIDEPEPHPLFYILEGGVEEWEVGAGNERVNR